MEADALQTALPGYPYKLVANIPYYIIRSSTFQSKNERRKRPTLIVLLVQKRLLKKYAPKGKSQHIEPANAVSETENYRPGS